MHYNVICEAIFRKERSKNSPSVVVVVVLVGNWILYFFNMI